MHTNTHTHLRAHTHALRYTIINTYITHCSFCLFLCAPVFILVCLSVSISVCLCFYLYLCLFINTSICLSLIGYVSTSYKRTERPMTFLLFSYSVFRHTTNAHAHTHTHTCTHTEKTTSLISRKIVFSIDLLRRRLARNEAWTSLAFAKASSPLSLSFCVAWPALSGLPKTKNGNSPFVRLIIQHSTFPISEIKFSFAKSSDVAIELEPKPKTKQTHTSDNFSKEKALLV